MFLNKNFSSAFFLSILEYLGSNFLFIFSKENPFLYISSILLKACLSRNVKLILFLLWLKEPRTTRCICHFGVKSPFGNSVAVLLSVFPYTFGFQLPENVIYTRPFKVIFSERSRILSRFPKHYCINIRLKKADLNLAFGLRSS